LERFGIKIKMAFREVIVQNKTQFASTEQSAYHQKLKGQGGVSNL